MNLDQIEADGKNCFLHPNNWNQYHTWEEARGTNEKTDVIEKRKRAIAQLNWL